MATPAHNTNGHRRRQLVARVKAEETHCAICGEWVDQSLTQLHGPGCDGDHIDNRQGCVPHPMGPVVDEIVPRVHGGSPLDRRNTALCHRSCNRIKGKRSLEWARRKVRGMQAEPEAQPATLVDW